MQKIVPFLWFDDQAEEAVKFYTSIFPNSKTGVVMRYDEASAKASGRPKGSVLTVDFQLNGQDFAALNGGPMYHFTPAVSFFVSLGTRREVDDLCGRLSEGGTALMELAKYPFSGRYGWVIDRFGVSWQIVPTILNEMLRDRDPEKASRVMEAMLKMTKIDIEALKRAYEQK